MHIIYIIQIKLESYFKKSEQKELRMKNHKIVLKE